ncbi:hypothetical protein SDC9_83834 [bioreactor metagenome]|uniref:Uncharacterized protein n=1 Tax=bioreactor metagenome TaxID=1076179 RepID=A0A644Z999_9ZZZZ
MPTLLPSTARSITSRSSSFIRTPGYATTTFRCPSPFPTMYHKAPASWIWTTRTSPRSAPTAPAPVMQGSSRCSTQKAALTGRRAQPSSPLTPRSTSTPSSMLYAKRQINTAICRNICVIPTHRSICASPPSADSAPSRRGPRRRAKRPS